MALQALGQKQGDGMKRTAGVMLLLAGIGGCVSTDGGGMSIGSSPTPASGPGTYMSGARQSGPMNDGPHSDGPQMALAAPGYQGAFGETLPRMAPATTPNLTGADFARAQLAKSMPADVLQQTGFRNVGMGSGLMQMGGQSCPPGGCPPQMAAMGGIPGSPGMMSGPGMSPPGAVAAVGALTGAMGNPFPVQRTSVRFIGPSGMKIAWYAPSPDGRPAFSPEGLTAPGSYNFGQAAIYRLKLSEIPLRKAVELYPTLEVVPANAKTSTFLAHSTVPVNITEEDLEQVAAGNYVVKVIYLPDPQYQDIAATGAEEVVSSRLEAGVDPIAEACRRGSILLVVRLGNINLELQHSPPVDAPPPYAVRPPQQIQQMPVGMNNLPAMPGIPMTGMPGAQAPGAGPAFPVNAAPGLMPDTLPPMNSTGPMGKAPAKSTGLSSVQYLPAPTFNNGSSK